MPVRRVPARQPATTRIHGARMTTSRMESHSSSFRRLAAEMDVAAGRERGRMGKYDAARKIFRSEETSLLNAIARGSTAAHARLDALRRSGLSFPQTYQEEGPLDPKGSKYSMDARGDFPLLALPVQYLPRRLRAPSALPSRALTNASRPVATSRRRHAETARVRRPEPLFDPMRRPATSCPALAPAPLKPRPQTASLFASTDPAALPAAGCKSASSRSRLRF